MLCFCTIIVIICVTHKETG